MFRKEKLSVNAFNRYGVLFFTISFLGWCFEKAGRYIVYNSVTDRGFLTLPICPIYASSILIIYFLVGSPRNMRIGVYPSGEGKAEKVRCLFLNVILYFLFSVFISTAVELSVGVFFNEVLGVSLWNYENLPLNLGGYISLGYCVLWGALITLFMLFIWEPLHGLFGRIDGRVLFAVNGFFCFLMTADFIFNIIYIIKTGEHFNFL